MNATTKAWAIANVADNWRRQYPGEIISGSGEKFDKYQRLLALPPERTEQDIAAIIGNGSWTRLICDNCEQSVDIYVRVGSDNRPYPVYICLDCLRQAVALAEQAVNNGL